MLFPNTIVLLREEPIQEPSAPELPPQQGLTTVEKARTAVVYSAEYQVFAEQREELRKEKKNLRDWLHNTKLGKSFRTNFETMHPNQTSMELDVYVQRLQEFCNSTISTLDSQRREHAKREWADIQQGERETIPE